MRSSILYSSAIFGPAVAEALAFWGPMKTLLPSIHADAMSPRPTEAPAFHELLRRQSSGETVLVAPDNTCGYVSGLPGAGYACNAVSATCVLAPSTTGRRGFVGCCDTADCGIRLTCLDLTQISSSSLCDNGCMVDTFTVKCTESSAKFCNTISFFSGISDYFCNSASISTPQIALTTYSGETGRTFSEVVLTDTSSLDTSTSRDTTTTRTTRSSATDTSSQSSSSDSSTALPISSGGGSSTPVGPIVAGVVGGVAVIGLIVLGVVLLMRKKRNENITPTTVASASAPPPPPTQPSMPPMQQHHAQLDTIHGSHQSYYAPPGLDPNKFGGQQPYVQPYPTQTPPPPTSGVQYLNLGMPPQQAQFQQQLDYHGQEVQANQPTSPMSEHHHNPNPNRLSTTVAGPPPISPSTTTGPSSAHQSYHQGFGPAPGQQQQAPLGVVHEAGGNALDGRRDYNADHGGHMHELA